MRDHQTCGRRVARARGRPPADRRHPRAGGDCVGYLEENGRYAFEGKALTEVAACGFDRRKFDRFAASHSDLAAATAEALSTSLKQTGRAMLVLGQLKSTTGGAFPRRNRHALSRTLHLDPAADAVHDPGDIADYLGLTIETVSRTTGKLRKRGIIGLAGTDEIVLLDRGRAAAGRPVGERRRPPAQRAINKSVDHRRSGGALTEIKVRPPPAAKLTLWLPIAP